jgi:AraC-like DNA-binding protein
MTSLTYSERRPPGDLAPWVACIWQIAGETVGAAPLLHRVLPDGCADLLFDLERARQMGGTPVELVGPMSTAQVIGLSGSIDLVGIRLRPGAIGAFGGIPANRLLDTAAPISELPVSFAVDVAQLADVADCSVRIKLLTDACRRRVAPLDRPDRLVREALDRWARAEVVGLPAISVLTRDLGLSERAFERRFVAQVGLTPVGYRRLARFRSMLRLYAAGSRDWAALAAITGFSDQSHLVRECRAFAGLTPVEWAESQGGGAGFLQDGEVTTF